MSFGGSMKPLFRLLAHLLFIGGMLVFYLLPADPYDWMREFDPAIAPDALENPSDDKLIFTVLLLIAITTAQAALLASSGNRLEKRVCIGLILIAAAFWTWKFGL